MNRKLRMRHAVIWFFLTILISILFAFAVSLIPEKVTQDKLYQEPGEKSEWISQKPVIQ